MGNLRKPLLGIIISILSCSLIISASYLQPAKTEIVPLDATYTVSFATDGGGLGSLTNPSGNQTYSAGQQISINAIADSGYSFSFWSAKPSNQVTFGNSNSASTTATINGNATITATFTQNSYALSAITVGSGSVSKSPNQASYLYGTIVNLTATPAAGWSFSSWIGDLTGSANPATVIVTKDMSVTATFTQITYQVTFSTSGSGTVSPSGVQTYAAGSMVSITASPSAGYSFASWTASPSSSVTFGNANAASTIAIINGAGTVTATFIQITYQVNFVTSGGGSGSSTNPSGSHAYVPGQVVSISASAGSGYRFSSWTATGSITFANAGSSSTTATINGEGTVTAVFNQIFYQVTFSTSGSGTVSPSGVQTYAAGSVVSISAAANTGYSFTSWTVNGSITIANSASAFTSATINGAGNVTATFVQNAFTLSVTTVGSGTVSKSPNQASYLYGTIVNLTAAPAAGWSFSSWIGDLTGSANPATVIVSKNMTVIANFTQITYRVSFVASGSGTVSPSGVQTYAAGSMVSITASPSAGYSFASWTASPSSSVTFGNANAASTNVTINGNATITATFTQITYQVTFAVSGSGTTSPTGTQTYLPSQVLSIFASPSAGFSFSSWSATPSDAITFANSISASTTATVNANGTITATFTQIPPTPIPTPSPAQNQNPTNTPQPTSTPTHQPTPTPQVFTTPVPSSMVIPATTADGSSVNLTIRGNGASSTISSATIKTDASNSTTTITLAITGQSATDGLSNITIPKQAVPFGTTPTVYVNNDIAQNQSYAQDAKNFYVSYKTYSKTYELLIIFAALSSSTGFPIWVFLTVILVITLSIAIVLSRKKIKKHLTVNYDNYSEYFSK